MTVFDAMFSATDRSPLCCGIDLVPSVVREWDCDHISSRSPELFVTDLVDQTLPLVCGYKIQRAYLDLLGISGLEILLSTVRYIRARSNGRHFVILDGKFGDIESTMRAYLSYAFDLVGVDCVTINPYLGTDSWKGLSEWPDRTGAMLTRTSNPSATQVQDRMLDTGVPLWASLLRDFVSSSQGSQLFPVLSHSVGAVVEQFDALTPLDRPLMFAGVGAQAIPIAALAPLVDRRGVFASSSRSIIGYEGSGDSRSTGERAAKLADELTEILRSETSP